jgi:hypothetical protein
VLGADEDRIWGVVDLADHFILDRGASKVLPARDAVLGLVEDDFVGIVPAHEGRAGLLATGALGLTPLLLGGLTVGRSSFSSALRRILRGGLQGVARALGKARLELGDLRREHLHLVPEGLILLAQYVVLGSEVVRRRCHSDHFSIPVSKQRASDQDKRAGHSVVQKISLEPPPREGRITVRVVRSGPAAT